MIPHPLDHAYLTAQTRRPICDWPTLFGPRKLQLANIHSKQARLLANATAGEESRQWFAAADWLDQVEHELDQAAQNGRRAYVAAKASDWSTALQCAKLAVSLESTYRPTPVWTSLLAAIEQLQSPKPVSY